MSSALAPSSNAADARPSPSDTRALRQALGSFATGVTVVTTRTTDGSDVGLTANSFNSVSLQPPLVLWSLAKSAGSLPAFMAAEHFAVHILARGQQPLSDRFARRSTVKFDGLRLTRGLGDVPLLTGCAATFQCRTVHRHEGGDHIIFVGEVLEFAHCAQPPLLFHGGAYASMLWEDPRPVGGDQDGFRPDFLAFLLGFAGSQIFEPIAQQCRDMGLAESAYYAITLVAARDGIELAELDQVLCAAGYRADAELADSLTKRGLFAQGGSGLRLTEAGRQLVLDLAAAAKVAEQRATGDLNEDETRQLKHLLRRLVRSKAGVHS